MTMKLSIVALAGVSLAAIAAPAAAQSTSPQPGPGSTPTAAAQGTGQTGTADDGQVIMVTAQRRSERVTDVPISISVADQAQLERQQINTIDDLNRIAPSLEIQSAPGQNTGGGGAIRGVGTQTFSPGAVASVGIVVDQVSQGNANIGDIFDVARVEVLKGPQGTLFGLTTSAGVINITTNAPDPSEVSGRFHTELSNQGTAGSRYGQQIVQGVVNVPVSDNAALRVSGLVNLRQGVDHNTIDDSWNHINRYAVRGRFLWEPTHNLSINLIGDYSHSRQTGGGDFFTFLRTGGPSFVPFPDPVGVTARLATCGVVARPGNQDFCMTQNLVDTNNNYGGSLQVDYDAGPLVLTSISAIRHGENQGLGTNIFRGDPLELQIVGGPPHGRINLLSQEVRISSPTGSRFEYTVGAFASHQRTVTDPAFFNITVVVNPFFQIPIVRTLGASSIVTDDSLALFGQGTYHIGDFRLIAGGRYTHAKLELARFDLDANAASSQSYSTGRVSWRFGAQYDFGPGSMAYATISRGFKGAQIAIPALPLLPYVVRPEIPTSFEAGIKWTLVRSLIMDFSLFNSRVHDFQAQQCSVNAATGGLSCVQANIDRVTSRGAEINVFGSPVHGLSLNTGFIYTHVTYPGGFVGQDGTNIGGTQLAYAPRYKFTFSGEYEHAVTSGLNGFIAVDTVWKSRIRYEANSLRDTTMPPHWLVGGRVGLRSANDRFGVALFVRNLFDVHEPSLFQSSFPSGGAANIGAIYGPQSFRQVGISLDASF